MKTTKPFRAFLALVLSATMALPHTAFGGQVEQQVEGIKISQKVSEVQLGQNGSVVGAIVDQQGHPVAGAPLVIGQNGKLVAKLKTDDQGRYKVEGLKTGVYQLVSFAGVEAFRTVEKTSGVNKGIVQVIDQEGIARGQQGGFMQILLAILQNPLVWALIIAAAIAIPLALDDDDAS